jgi:hypothetical protein
MVEQVQCSGMSNLPYAPKALTCFSVLAPLDPYFAAPQKETRSERASQLLLALRLPPSVAVATLSVLTKI